MSDDVVTRAATPVEKLEAVHRELRFNSVFFWIGWMLLGIGFFNMQMGYGLWSGIFTVLLGSTLGEMFMRVGWGIIGLPKIIAMLFGGFGAALKGPLVDYEVVTTYGNGRVVSDGGAQSMQTNIILKLILIGVLYLLGGIITIFHLITLTFKYMGLRVKANPILKPTGLVIMILNILMLLGGPVAGGAMQNAHNQKGSTLKGNYRYEKNGAGNGIIIRNYTGKNGGDIVIPAQFEGLPVVEIKLLAFSEKEKDDLKGLESHNYSGAIRRTRITSIVIPDTVVHIGDDAFNRCKQLTKITIGANVSIHKNAFDNGFYQFYYDVADRAAGTYVMTNGAWAKQ